MKNIPTILLFSLLLSSCAIFTSKDSSVQARSATIPGVDMVRQDGVIYYVHLVKAGETLYSLSKYYGTPIDIITADNPSLKDGLKAGSIIYVRKTDGKIVEKAKETTKDQENKIDNQNKVDDQKNEDNNISEESKETVITFPKIDRKSTLYEDRVADNETNVTLLLPFGNGDPKSAATNNFLDFYQGFLLAVQEMQSEGMDLNLTVLNTDDYKKTDDIVISGELNKSDLIIGPVFADRMDPIVRFSTENCVPMVSPMDPNGDNFLQNNPYFFQASTPSIIQQESLINDISNNSTVLLLYDPSELEKNNIQTTKELLSQRGIRYSEFSYTVTKGKSAGNMIRSLLNKGDENKIIIQSDSEAFVSDVLRQLEVMSQQEKYNITIYGTPRWRNFKSIDFNVYHALNLHISLQYAINYNSEEVKNFLSKYRALYRSEPSPYAFQAYDTGLYFLNLLYTKGVEFTNTFDRVNRKSLLQTDFNFVRDNSNNGYVNTASRSVIYNPDYSVKVVIGLSK